MRNIPHKLTITKRFDSQGVCNIYNVDIGIQRDKSPHTRALGMGCPTLTRRVVTDLLLVRYAIGTSFVPRKTTSRARELKGEGS